VTTDYYLRHEKIRQTSARKEPGNRGLSPIICYCGGALAFSEPDKSLALIKNIIESAYDGGADLIVTPCPVCQMNLEVYQNHINPKYKTNLTIMEGSRHPEE